MVAQSEGVMTEFTRAGGPTRVNVEKPKNVNEGNDVEKPKREPYACLTAKAI